MDMNLTQAVARACQEPTFVEGLTFLAVWETERVVAQAKRDVANPDGSKWETCFGHIFKEFVSEWKGRNGPRLMRKERLDYIRTVVDGQTLVPDNLCLELLADRDALAEALP